MKFVEGIEIWRRYKIRAWKPGYAESNGYSIAQLVKYFGSVELSTIGIEQCERFRESLSEKGLRPATLNRVRAVMSSFFKYARLHGWMDRNSNPLGTWECVRARPPADWKQIASAAEEEKLLQECDLPTALFVMIALYTGLRRGAVVALRWEWMPPDLSFVNVPPEHMKSNREHRVPLAPKLREALAPLRPADGLGPIFNQHISPSAWSMRFKRAVRALGLNPKLKLHDLRRTFGTRLAEKGVPVPTIQRLGDWSTASIFYRDYLARLGDDAARSAIDKL
jgi:integrase